MRKIETTTIPLRVLVVDRDSPSTRLLLESLDSSNSVIHLAHTQDLNDARAQLEPDNINTIVINPLGFEIESSSAFIFEIRKDLPEIVFVFFQDQKQVEENREEYFHGERRRFSHYYRLDKRTPPDSFDDELAAMIRLCQSDLSWRMSKESLSKLRDQASENGKTSTDDNRVQLSSRAFIQENTVFVSHRFAEADTHYVKGLTRYLVDKGFEVKTGKLATGTISQAVLQRIQDAEFFLSLLTRADQKRDGMYTASAWLHQELGAALAFRKPVVLMVEQGVTDLGGLQGDIQRIPFEEKEFMNAALDSVALLGIYAGQKAR